MTPEQMIEALAPKFFSLRSACFTTCCSCGGAQNFEAVDWIRFMEEVHAKKMNFNLWNDFWKEGGWHVRLYRPDDIKVVDPNPRIALLTAVYRAMEATA